MNRASALAELLESDEEAIDYIIAGFSYLFDKGYPPKIVFDIIKETCPYLVETPKKEEQH